MNIPFLVLILTITVVTTRGHVRRSGELQLADISLYDGDDVDELLSLCYYLDEPRIDPEDFQSYYTQTTNPEIDGDDLRALVLLPRCPTLDVGIHSGMSEEDEREHLRMRFTDLRVVQHLIHDYHEVVTTTTSHYYGEAIILGICVGIGIYLVVVGHYQWRTLIDEFHPDGSHGVPCWQYLRMRYVAAKVRGNTKNKSLLVPKFDTTSNAQQKSKGTKEKSKGTNEKSKGTKEKSKETKPKPKDTREKRSKSKPKS